VVADSRPAPDHRLGVTLAAAGVLFISLDALWLRLSEADSWDAAFWVGVFTFFTISAVLPLRTGRSIAAVVRRDRGPLLLSAVLSTGSVTFFILSIGLTAVANTVAIIAAAPVAAAVLARFLIAERPTRRAWAAIGGSVAGIMIIVAGSIGSGSVSGDLLAVAAVVAFAANVSLWRRFPGVSRLGVAGLSGLFIAVATFVPAEPLPVEPRTLAFLALMGAVTGPIGRISLATSTRHLPAAQVGLFTPLETVAATAWAWLFLAEAPPMATVIGGLVVIVAVVYGSRVRAR